MFFSPGGKADGMRTSGKSGAENMGTAYGAGYSAGKVSGTGQNSGTGRNAKSGSTGKISGTGGNTKSGGMGKSSGTGAKSKNSGAGAKSVSTGKYTGNRSGGKKAESVPLVRGVLMSAGIFLCGMILLSAGIFSGAAHTDEMFPAMAAVTFIAAFAGAFSTVRRTSHGTLAAALLTGGISALILIGCALAVCDRIAWTGNAGILLLCILAGSTAQRGSRRNKRTR